MIKKIVYALWALLAVGMLAVVFMFYSVTKGWIGFVPPVEELEQAMGVDFNNLQVKDIGIV